jgi:hypothetical protein
VSVIRVSTVYTSPFRRRKLPLSSEVTKDSNDDFHSSNLRTSTLIIIIIIIIIIKSLINKMPLSEHGERNNYIRTSKGIFKECRCKNRINLR